MYIRMKLRTLVILLMAMLAAIALVVFEVPGWLLRAQRYDAIIHYFPYSREMPAALWEAAQLADPPSDTANQVYILPGNEISVMGPFPPPFDPSAAVSDLQALLQRRPHGPHTDEAHWELAQAQQQLGHLPAAVKLYKAIAADNASAYHAKAQSVLAGLGFASWGDTPASDAVGFGSGGSGGSGGSDKSTETRKSTGVTGVVTVDGHPLANAFVFLRSTSDENMFVTPPMHQYPGAYTNGKGVYHIDKVAQGAYQVGVAVTLPQVAGSYLPDPADALVNVVDGQTAKYNLGFVPQVQVVRPTGGSTIQGDKLTFQWKAYPGAATYRVILYAADGATMNGDYMEADLPGTFTGTSATFSIAKLRRDGQGVGGSKNSEVGLLTSSILGSVHPDGAYSWAVDAYDSHGDLVSSSRAYYIGPGPKARGTGSGAGGAGTGGSSRSLPPPPIFYTSTNGELQGDKYVLQHQYAKAKQAYEQEGDRRYALRALGAMALYGVGWKDKGNPQEALQYLERIKNPGAAAQKMIAEAKKRIGQ